LTVHSNSLSKQSYSHSLSILGHADAPCRPFLKMDFHILEFNGESDHIHALIDFPPKLSISQIVNALKGVSSPRYGQGGFPKPYGKQALWSPSYFVSSVGGAPLQVLKKYIHNQEKPSFYDGVFNPFF